MPTSTHPSLWKLIEQSIESRGDELVRFRRRLHATPEPSGEERATTSLLAQSLDECGLSPRVMTGGFGVLADIDLGAPDASFIAIRAELDCVRVNDDKQEPYASTRPGLCHACGHDAHTTMALAAARALAQHREQAMPLRPRHNVRVLFQPAEENATGARSMIQQGALDGVKAILALHVEPCLDVGMIGLRAGAMTAACKLFRATVRGRGGHSARPHEAVDPIPAAVNLVSQLYQLAPRSMDGRHPLALTVGAIHAGAAANAIPDEATIAGTLRTTRDQDTEAVQLRMQAVADGVALATGCRIELEFLHSCPQTNNDPHLVEEFALIARELLGPKSVQWIEQPSMGGEDFAFYQELIPGVIVRLGAGLADGRPRRPLHSSLFDIDERALPLGAKLLARAAVHLAMTHEGER